MRNMALSTIDAMVLAAVKPAWAGMRKAVETLRPLAEPKIREATEPIFKLENEIVGKMKGNRGTRDKGVRNGEASFYIYFLLLPISFSLCHLLTLLQRVS
jgi:hypothetical protein